MRKFKRLAVHVPSLGMFAAEGTDKTLTSTHESENPLLSLLGARWFSATRNQPRISVAEDLSDFHDSFIVLSDRAAAYESTWAGLTPEDLARKGNQVFIVSCLGKNDTNVLRGAHNAYDYPWGKRVSSDGLYNLSVIESANDGNVITLPLGCGQDWLPDLSGRYPEPVILLDEVHQSVIDEFQDKGRFDVAAFEHSLDVCRELFDRGFRIVTFCRESQEFINSIRDRHPFLEVIDWQGWMPFQMLAEHYAAAPLFYSHFHEAHGYPIYENLQMGNGVIGYVESMSPIPVRQFQNGVMLSVSMPAPVAADLISAYFDHYTGAKLQGPIAADGHARFSCETFVPRLIDALKLNNITFG